MILKQAKFDAAVNVLLEVVGDYVKVKNPMVNDVCQNIICCLAKEIIAACEEDTPKKSEMPCNRCKCDVPETTIAKAFDDIINAVSTLADEVETLIEEKEKKNVQS